MRIYQVVICSESYGYFKSERRAIEKAKWVLRNCILNMDSEDDVLCYERICKELDEQGYSMEIEVNIFVDRVDMED